MTKYSILIIIFNLLFGLTGYELIQKMETRLKPIDSKTDFTMTLTNKKGKTRSCTLRSISKNDGARQIIWFLSPADDKGVALLKIEHKNKLDEMHIWLPAFKRVRRIAPSKRSNSFMGSDLSYEDLSSRKIDEFNYTIIDENKNDNPTYLLEIIPKKHLETEYSRHLTWIDSTLLIPIKEKSFDKENKLLKEKYFKYSLISDYQILKEVQVKNIQTNHSTSLVFSNIILNNDIKNNFFNEKNLKYIPN